MVEAVTIACAGDCGAVVSFTTSFSNAVLEACARWLKMSARGWIHDGAWWCRYCIRRKRLIKPV